MRNLNVGVWKENSFNIIHWNKLPKKMEKKIKTKIDNLINSKFQKEGNILFNKIKDKIRKLYKEDNPIIKIATRSITHPLEKKIILSKIASFE